MVWHRTTARGVLFLLLLWVSAGTAQAGPPPERIIFPVVGNARFSDDFGAARAQGGHQGNDILAARKAPAVAAEAGRVKFHTTSWRAGCMLYLYGRSGTTYLYIHLNNDLTRENDNRGKCVRGVAYAPGLRDGQRVRAGQLVGFVGDSGDADGGSPHLHFELHPNDGAAVSPYPWLRSARRLLFAAPASTTEVSLTLYGRAQAVDGDRLTVLVRRVRLARGWAWDVRRNVILAVVPYAVVERVVDGVRELTTLDSVVRGERITVWTPAFAPTLATQLAAPGTLNARRVLFRGT